MTLQKQKIPVNLAKGVSTKVDSRHLEPGQLPVLKNARMRGVTRIDKRNGHDLASKSVYNVGGSLSASKTVFSYKDELLLYNGTNVYSYSEDIDKWFYKGRASFTKIDTDDVQSVINSSTKPSVASTGTYTGIISIIDNKACVTIYNETTKTYLSNAYAVNLSGLSDVVTNVRALEFNGLLYFFWSVPASNDIIARTWNPSTGSFGSQPTIVSDCDGTNARFDVANFNDSTIGLIYNDSGGTTITIKFFTGAFAAAASDKDITITGGANAMAISYTNAGYFIAAWGYTGKTDAIYLEEDGTEPAGTVSGFSVDSSNSADHIGIVSLSNNTIHIYYDYSSTHGNIIESATVSDDGFGGGATGQGVFKYNSIVYSDPFEYNGSHYVLCASDNGTADSFHLVKNDGLCVSTLAYELAPNSVASGFMCQPLQINSVWNIFYEKKFDYNSTASGTPTTGISRSKVNFTGNNLMHAKEFSENLFVAGGQLQEYDGLSFFEHNFNAVPSVSTSSDDAGGSLADGAYSFIFCWEWLDANGNSHKSAPSIAESVTVSGRSGSGECNLSVRTLQYTEKNSGLPPPFRADVNLVGYVTEASGTTYYRFTDSGDYVNDIDAATITVTYQSASGLTSNEILYTTGGVLENNYPPPCTSLAVYKERLWLAGTDDNEQVWFSKKNLINEPVEFNSTLYLKSPSKGGRDTAIGVLDDKLVLFKDRKFFYTYGDGPNDLGVDGSFSDFEEVNSDTGSENPHSVVEVPSGLMVKNSRGIYGIDTSFSVSYIGADVEAYNSYTVTSAIMTPGNKNEVKFTTTSSVILVYDYILGVWSVDTGITGVRAIDWNGTYVVCDSSANVYIDNSATFLDGSTSYSLELETGWFSFDGIGGFQRCYHMQMRGDYKTDHTMAVSVGYDYKTTYDHTVSFNPLTDIGASTPYRYQIYPEQQKCESIRFKIVETSLAGTEQSLSINDLMFLVGIKRGTAKLPTVQTKGAT